VVAGEALELEGKMHDRVLRGAQQRVAEPETGGGDGGREDGVRADRQEPAGAPLHLDQSERAARPRRGQELVHERAVHRQPGQQRDNMAHSSSAASGVDAASITPPAPGPAAEGDLHHRLGPGCPCADCPDCRSDCCPNLSYQR